MSNDSRNPNYIAPKYSYYCSICNDGIRFGEEYIKNDSGEVVHYECIKGKRELIKWLGFAIEEMKEGETNE